MTHSIGEHLNDFAYYIEEIANDNDREKFVEKANDEFLNIVGMFKNQKTLYKKRIAILEDSLQSAVDEIAEFKKKLAIRDIQLNSLID